MSFDTCDFEQNPITEQEVIAILGNQYKVQGDELVWRCPACPNGDKSGDNLKFNRTKRILKCFACDYGTVISSIIARRRFEAEQGEYGEDYTPSQTPYALPPAPSAPVEQAPKEKEIKEDDLELYYWNCHIALMKRKDILRAMFHQHTIMPKTAAECLIGYDENKDMLVFPSRAVGKDPTNALCSYYTPNGAEYREYTGAKTIRRISGYDSQICCVYTSGGIRNPQGSFIMHGILCEGYKDAYNLYQVLKMTEPERLSYTAIFTVQNGTNSINTNNCLQKTNWKMLEEMYLLMDNDDAGNKATELAQNLFSNMKDMRGFLQGCNDVQELFKKYYAPKVDIEKALSASWLDDYQDEEPCPF